MVLVNTPAASRNEAPTKEVEVVCWNAKRRHILLARMISMGRVTNSSQWMKVMMTVITQVATARIATHRHSHFSLKRWKCYERMQVGIMRKVFVPCTDPFEEGRLRYSRS